jgi:DNA-binding FrmR family transcriptional regulator
MKPQKIKLTIEDRKELLLSMKKIIGQMNAVTTVIENNEVTDLTFNQLLAVKGGATRICKEIISKGVVPNFKNYSPQQIDQALNVIFRLD